MKKSVYRIILMVLGGLQAILFFVLPYATLNEVMGALSGLASGLGDLMGSSDVANLYPEKLTGLAAVKMGMAMPTDDGKLFVGLFLPSVFLALIVFLMSLIGKKRLSYIGSLLFSLALLAEYGLISIIVPEFEQMGYKTGAALFVFLAMSAVQAVVALVGCFMDKTVKAGAAANAGTGAKPAKKEKNGTKKESPSLVGLKGAYEGAVIPMKIDEDLVIGRDPSVCSVVINGDKISRKHCVIRPLNSVSYQFTDTSTNGVFNKAGEKLTKAAILNRGDQIKIGDDVFELR